MDGCSTAVQHNLFSEYGKTVSKAPQGTEPEKIHLNNRPIQHGLDLKTKQTKQKNHGGHQNLKFP
jgi:hypothetical protein